MGNTYIPSQSQLHAKLQQHYFLDQLPLLTHRQTLLPFTLHHLVANSPQQYHQFMEDIDIYRSSTSPAITTYQQHYLYNKQSYCTDQQHLYIIFHDHAQLTLHHHYLTRKSNRQSFTNAQIILILQTTLMGVREYHHRFGRKFHNLWLGTICTQQNTNRIYVKDPWLDTTPHHKYHSPEKLQSLIDLIPINQFHADLFTIGIIALQLIYMTDMLHLYQPQPNSHLIHSLINNITHQYLKDGLNTLLQPNPNKRVDIYRDWNISYDQVRKLPPTTDHTTSKPSLDNTYHTNSIPITNTTNTTNTTKTISNSLPISSSLPIPNNLHASNALPIPNNLPISNNFHPSNSLPISNHLHSSNLHASSNLHISNTISHKIPKISMCKSYSVSKTNNNSGSIRVNHHHNNIINHSNQYNHHPLHPNTTHPNTTQLNSTHLNSTQLNSTEHYNRNLKQSLKASIVLDHKQQQMNRRLLRPKSTYILRQQQTKYLQPQQLTINIPIHHKMNSISHKINQPSKPQQQTIAKPQLNQSIPQPIKANSKCPKFIEDRKYKQPVVSTNDRELISKPQILQHMDLPSDKSSVIDSNGCSPIYEWKGQDIKINAANNDRNNQQSLEVQPISQTIIRSQLENPSLVIQSDSIIPNDSHQYLSPHRPPQQQNLIELTPPQHPNKKYNTTIIEVNEQTPQCSDLQNSRDQQYVIEEYETGSKYEGFKINGMRSGKGKFFYQDGGHYEGEWKNNKMHGWGKLFYEGGQLAYEGNWRHDQFHGYGKVYNDNPIKLNEPFDYTNFDNLDDYWEYYEGTLVSDCKEGRGTIKLTNGEIFEGDFHCDRIQGFGKFYTISKNYIEGIWRQSKLIKIINTIEK